MSDPLDAKRNRLVNEFGNFRQLLRIQTDLDPPELEIVAALFVIALEIDFVDDSIRDHA